MSNIKDNIIFFDQNEWFDPSATLECGQVFRYQKITNGYFNITYGNKNATIKRHNDHFTNIICKNSEEAKYFYDYFDCSTDYVSLNKKLVSLPFLSNAIGHSFGLRLLRQEPYETLISFIISANNNIPRIRATIERLATELAMLNHKEAVLPAPFPTPSQMAAQDVEFYKRIGCGYRAEYLVKTAKIVDSGFDLATLKTLETDELINRLRTFAGVGPKVADCIALFAYRRFDVFPVDTWVRKIYNDIFGHDDSPKAIRKNLLNLYGEYAGLAQQYLFYAKRAIESKFKSPDKN